MFSRISTPFFGAIHPLRGFFNPTTRSLGTTSTQPDFSVDVTVENKIAIVEIARPKAKNALNVDLLQRLSEIISSFQPIPLLNTTSYPIRGMVLTASGDIFISGADINMFVNTTEQKLRKNIQLIHSVANTIENAPFPTVCALNGHTFGGGAELAFAADLIVAAEEVRIGLVEPTIGLIPGGGGTQRLYRRISWSNANQMLLSADPIDAKKALDIGLISVVCSKANLLKEATTLVQSMIKNPPTAIASIKRARKAALGSMEEGLKVETDEFIRCWKTPEAQYRINEFINKRRQK